MLTISLPKELSATLGQRLQQRRLDRAWSREELAKRSGVTAASIKRFESTGQIALERLLSLCFTLGCIEDFNKILLSPEPTTMQELKSRVKKRKRGRTAK